MAGRISYSEKLKDPRWQKKRLKILERDGWKCVCCGDGESTLHVHHFYYRSGWEPWDYHDKALVTLCEECHRIETELRVKAEEELILILREEKFFVGDLIDFTKKVGNLKPGWGCRLTIIRKSK